MELRVLDKVLILTAEPAEEDDHGTSVGCTGALGRTTHTEATQGLRPFCEGHAPEKGTRIARNHSQTEALSHLQRLLHRTREGVRVGKRTGGGGGSGIAGPPHMVFEIS
jgi:hypothetical protein